MDKNEVLFPTADTTISGKSSNLFPFNCHSNVIGKSPSETVHETSTNCPACTGLSSK